ncbi:glycine cleavage system protein R [Photobacterium aquae]|uniref:Glycine cleavage system transcriptional repressor n=1 Tax=Photobacterium aquae TaxID=1195763 RepID=A0A0J1JVX3_9GAMM|nr:glycine cleavage system protein R [Photobacterium aquae]KLV06452.1 glycine cleavage system protein R [Photobacterium aquae]
MEHYLVVTAVGKDRPGISDEIIRLITQCGCNIIDSRLALLGSEFTLFMLLSGNANAITRVESTLPLTALEHDLLTVMKRTSKHEQRYSPYSAEFHVEANDSPGLTEPFTRFLAARGLSIASLSAQTLESNTPETANTFQLLIGTTLPEGCNLMTLQEEFEVLCHTLQVTGKVTFVGHNQ